MKSGGAWPEAAQAKPAEQAVEPVLAQLEAARAPPELESRSCAQEQVFGRLAPCCAWL